MAEQHVQQDYFMNSFYMTFQNIFKLYKLRFFNVLKIEVNVDNQQLNRKGIDLENKLESYQIQIFNFSNLNIQKKTITYQQYPLFQILNKTINNNFNKYYYLKAMNQIRQKQVENYAQYIHRKKQLELPIKLYEYTDIQERIIKNQNKGGNQFLGCYTNSTKKKYSIDEQFITAFSTLTTNEQKKYYINCIKFLMKYSVDQQEQQDQKFQQKYKFNVYVRGGTFNRSWVSYTVQVNSVELKATIPQTRDSIDFRQYLIRKSNNKEKKAFVLEAVKPKIQKSYRIGFDQEQQLNNCYDLLYQLVMKAQHENLKLYFKISKQLKIPNKPKSNGTNQLQSSLSSKKNPNYDSNSNVKLRQHEQEEQKSISNIINGMKVNPKMRISNQISQKRQDEQSEEQQQQIHNISHSLILNKMQNVESLQERLQKENENFKTYRSIKRQQQNYKSNMNFNSNSRNRNNSFENDFEQNEEFKIIKEKQNLDIFHILLPNYELSDLYNDSNYRIASNDNANDFQINKSLRILEHKNQINNFRLNLRINQNIKTVIAAIANIQNYKLWNHQVILANIQMRITAENSQVGYIETKSYNRFYKQRDYLFLRHLFKENQYTYIVDKSITNDLCPPFSNIERGEIVYALWSFRQIKVNETYLILEIVMDQKGYLTRKQSQNLTLMYLKEFSNLESYIQNNKIKLTTPIEFELNWDIANNELNKKLKTKKSLFNQNLCSEIESEFVSIKQDQWDGDFSDQFSVASAIEQQQVRQVQEVIQENHSIKTVDFKLNKQGYAILEKDYLKKKYKFSPVPAEYIPNTSPQWSHYLWRNLWEVQKDIGVIKCIDLKKLAEQNGVFSHVLKDLAKNIFSGKSPTISLPVQIFSEMSNLQLAAKALTLAPKMLEKAVKLDDPVQRFKYCIALGLSNSLLYLQMQKPFNPILGETFQGWINGCPIFCEQISHHPPISAFLMQGRGYKIYGNFESKINLSINSGVGYNDGTYIIEFEKYKSLVKFRSPGGEIQGLAYGDRKFLYTGKALFWDQSNHLYFELSFNPSKKYFGKQDKPCDYMQGTIYQVTSQFFNDFDEKPKTPSKSQIVKTHATATGRWTECLKFNNMQYYNIDLDIPCLLQQQKYPLHSNSNYREDIIYRRKADYPRARIQKIRLEELQRSDRKWRQKLGKGAKHH